MKLVRFAKIANGGHRMYSEFSSTQEIERERQTTYTVASFCRILQWVVIRAEHLHSTGQLQSVLHDPFRQRGRKVKQMK